MLSGASRLRSGREGIDGARVEPATLQRCFSGLETASGFVLAVSGGPDSMALLLMATAWAENLGAGSPKIHVATVDHGFRPESQGETALVASVAHDLRLPHTTLTWAGPKPLTRLQERARTARYGLLADHARTIGASHILTAHHADDQAETILLRLGRGSGLAGLAGIRRLSSLAPGLTLARPLLDMTKTQLVSHCRAALCDFVEDPWNRDPVFARARLRALSPQLEALGLDQLGLNRLARRMARADAALEREVDRIETALAPDRGDRVYLVDLTHARTLPLEIAVRLLGRGVAYVATYGDDVAGGHAIRLERLESLTEALWRALDEGDPQRASLARTHVSLGRDRILTISAERPRRRGRGAKDDATLPVLRPN